MDQGGLKRNGNRDDSLTFAESGAGIRRDTGDTSGLMHLPGSGSLTQPTVAPNGRGGFKDPGEFGGIFESPQHYALREGAEMKEGKLVRMQKPQQDINIFNMEDNLSLSISDLSHMSTSVISTSDSSILGNLPLPDLFPQNIKQEETFSMDKDIGSYIGHPGTGPCDLDGNSSRLIEETEIWPDLDLEISDFELDSEVAHLDTILHDTSGGGGGPDSGLLKETKSLVGNGGNSTSVNGTEQQHHPIHHHLHQQQHQQHQLHPQHQQPPSIMTNVMIKEEKDLDDSFIHIRTPGVVKQEKEDRPGFCQASCFQSSMGALQGGGPMSSPVGVGAGSGYHYRANPATRVDLQDQKPFGMYSNLPPGGESWSGGNRFGESSGMHRGNEGLPSTPGLATFPISFSRWVFSNDFTFLCLAFIADLVLQKIFLRRHRKRAAQWYSWVIRTPLMLSSCLCWFPPTIVNSCY